MKKCRVTIVPENRVLLNEKGTLILDITEDAGIVVSTPCGGKGICGKCLVRAEGPLSEKSQLEKKLIRSSDFNNHLRLACSTRIEGDVTIYSDSIEKKSALTAVGIDLNSHFGIAVDIGTTSVQISLVDMVSTTTYPAARFLNPQRRFGYDVISRIDAASDKKTAERISSLIRNEISSSIMHLIDSLSLNQKQIKAIVFSGNTAMTYFLFGLDATPLGSYPYTVLRRDFNDFRPENINIALPNTTGIFAMPAASAFLGGDLTGGLALLDRKGYSENVFFMDLGTNGEMFLRGRGDDIYATSCAMGPALEGMNISSGMTADDGAINHVFREQGAFRYAVLGNSTATGICGTGIIDFMAEMLESGILSGSGAFNAEYMSPEKTSFKGIHFNEKNRAMHLTETVYLTQKDIRTVQLAKGASLAASRILLDEAGIRADSIKHVFIAGAFGENLDLKKFKALSFIPQFNNAIYHFAGNTSLKAAELSCIDPEFRTEAARLRDRIQAIELSDHSAFNDIFMQSLDF